MEVPNKLLSLSLSLSLSLPPFLPLSLSLSLSLSLPLLPSLDLTNTAGSGNLKCLGLLTLLVINTHTLWSIVPNKLPLFEIGSLSGYK